MTTTGTQEYSVVPHTLNVWRSLRGIARPGDRLMTSLQPMFDEDRRQALTHAAWLDELIQALDEGIEVHCEECGNLRHGAAVLRALARTMAGHETETARQRAQAVTEADEARAQLKAEYTQGFKDGMAAAGAVEKAANAREQARQRQARKRAKDPAEARAEGEARAAADAAERADPASPHFTPDTPAEPATAA